MPIPTVAVAGVHFIVQLDGRRGVPAYRRRGEVIQSAIEDWLGENAETLHLRCAIGLWWTVRWPKATEPCSCGRGSI